MRASQPRSLFFVTLTLGLTALILVWSFSSREDDKSRSPEFAGVYVEGVAGSPARVNPLFAPENATDATIAALVFAGLTRLDEEGSPFPDMAETWSISPDQLTYTFTLRAGLRWHDGAAVTADDVLFTYELLRDPALAIPPALTAILADAAVTSPDSRTIVVRLSAPFAPLPAYLTLGIVPKHTLGDLTILQIYDSFFNQNPVGSGPYRLARLTPSMADLQANPTYHLDQPFLKNVELRFYRNDAEVVDALERGDVNAAVLAGENAAIDRPGVRVTPLDTGQITYVYLNLDNSVFADRRVRQALLYAVDRKRVVGQLVAISGVVAESPLSPATWAFSPSVRRYDYDQQLAGLLLGEAGWTLDANGQRQSDGVELSISLAVDSDPVRVAVAEAVADAWRSVGIQVLVQSFGASDYLRQQIAPRAFEAAIWTQPAAPDPDPFDFWHSASSPDASRNLSGFADGRIDRLLAEARRVSQPERRDLYLEFQELFAQELPALPLYVTTSRYVQDQDLQSVRVGLATQPGDRFWQIQEWFIDGR